MTGQENEKRGYFRIEDVVGLKYCELENGESFPAPQKGGASDIFQQVFDDIDVALNRVVNTIWQENPSVAKALGLLNRKINLIAEQCPWLEEPSLANFREQSASISGSGMSFTTSEQYRRGARLGISVILQPSNIQLQFTASVVECEPLQEIPNELYLLRLRIDDENEAEKEQLVQHVVQKQYVNLGSESVEEEA